MQEDKREKVRLASDDMFLGLGRIEWRHFVTPEDELQAARERARLSVLNLSPHDKRFLKAMKIAV